MAQALQLDTLRLARKLTDAGLDARVAEAVVEALAQADTQDLLTKADLANRVTMADLKVSLAEFKAEVSKQLWIMGVCIVGLIVVLTKFLP